MLRARLRHEKAGDLVISNEFGPLSKPSRSKGARNSRSGLKPRQG